jgi:hypothetical protein
MSFTVATFRQHNALRWDGPMYPYYSSHLARMQSFFITWPASSKQKQDDLSIAGFFHTGLLLYN